MFERNYRCVGMIGFDIWPVCMDMWLYDNLSPLVDYNSDNNIYFGRQIMWLLEMLQKNLKCSFTNCATIKLKDFIGWIFIQS